MMRLDWQAPARSASPYSTQQQPRPSACDLLRRASDKRRTFKNSACYLFAKLFTLGVLEWTCLRHKVQRTHPWC
eukprot:UN3485